MASATSEKVEGGLREWGSGGMEGPGDQELLGQFLEGDEAASAAAFQALVTRHGPMVLGVCRHILERLHDAEDAFQATFLVLARNAGTIRDRRVLARWLYEVAYRIAVRAKTRSTRRKNQEKEAAAMSAVAAGHTPETDPAWNELRPVLHEEVNRLPEKYRSAVVLCYLEGRTNEEAAEMLRWPVGTVKGRLSRAREMLRSRLTRRGLAISATFLATRLSQNTVFAEVVPARLIELTSYNALAFTHGGHAGAALVSSDVLDLAEDALNAPVNLPARGVSQAAIGVVLAALLLVGLLTLITRGQDSGSGRPQPAVVLPTGLTGGIPAVPGTGTPSGPPPGPATAAAATAATTLPGSGPTTSCH
jgi:RNA polymerase sigma factor (sigma-70 family)